jgi:hypothetical protein
MDNRANGVMLLRAIVNRWGDSDAVSDLLACLCLERNSSVINTVGHLSTVVLRMTAANLDTMSVIALRSPRYFHQFGDLIALLPEAVRCCVNVGYALDELLPSETMSLIGERVAFVLAQLAGSGDLGFEGLFLWTDLEQLARETCSEVLRLKPFDTAFAVEVLADPPLLEGALRVLEQIATPSCERHHAALMHTYVLDYLIIPLTRYRSLPDLWPRARVAAERLCDALALSDHLGREVPRYRALVAGELDVNQTAWILWPR